MNRDVFGVKKDLERLCSVLCMILVAVVFATNDAEAELLGASQPIGAEGVQEGNSAARETSLRLLSVEPTVLFVEQKGDLLQVAKLTIENTSKATEASVDVKLGSEQRTVAIGEVKNGRATFQLHVPDIDKAAPVDFVLRANGKVQDSHKTTWRPSRHWKVFIVPITHHDLGYTNTIENVLHLYDEFYDNVLAFCEQTDHWPEESKYRYTVEGTWSIQHFIENRPEHVTDKLGKYVQQGRIDIGALFGNEISALCSHEQLIRLMYPAFRLKRKYGAKILTGSITDVPGLSWGLPTVLSGAGVKYFFAGLPTYFEWGRNDIHTFWDESAILRHGRPDAFHWQGPDGQTVLVYYQSSYGFFNGVTGPHSYKDVMDRLPGMLDTIQKRGSEFDVVRYIHNGVDNHPPEVKISHIVREWNSKWAYPKLIVATNSMFFEALEKQCGDIRTFRGELPHTDYVVGAVSTAKETAINRIAHDRLHSAEKSATVASIVSDYSYPAEKIRTAYDNMMLYDEHTWGKAYPAGEEQNWAWNEKSHYAYKAAGLSEAILSGSLRRIADKIELKEQGRHIVVFNTLSFARTDVVRVTRFDVREPFELVDEQTGHKVPCQIVKLDSALAPVPFAAHRYARGQFEQHELFDLVFIAEDVPPLGYKTYRLLSKEKADSNQGSVVVSADRLENRFFSVTIDRQSGAIESIYDKELSREIVDKNAQYKLNQLVARWVQSGKVESQNKAKVRKGQSGPVYGSVVVSSEGPGCPQLTQEIILYDKIKRIDLSNRLLKDSTPLLEIYFAFPFKIDNPDFRFEGSNSVIEPLRDQFPGSNSNYYAVQHWANVSDDEIGVTLSPVESHLIEFGGLWPCYVSQAHHGFTPPDFGREFVKADEIDKGHMYAFVLDSNFRTNFQPVQQGDMLFRYSITAHTAKWREGGRRDFGWAVGNPLIPVLVHGKRQGTLESQMSFCQVDKPNVFLLTLKRAEDGDGTIVRLIETEGKDVAATVTLPHLTVKKAYLTNLVEENKGEATFTPHSIEAHLKAFGITTIRIQTP